MHLLRQLRAALFITVVWGVASAITGAIYSVVIDLIIGSVYSILTGIIFNVQLFGILGLTFGATFALAFGVLGRFLPEQRVPTWLAALVGGVAAPLGGILLLASLHSFMLLPLVVAVMALLGTGIGAAIGYTANLAKLPAGSSSAQLRPGREAIGAGE